VSGRKDREERREERLQEEQDVDAAERRQRAIKLASALAFLAIAAVAVLIVISQSQSSGGDASDVAGAAEVRAELDGIPQRGMVLGEPGAKVTLYEYGDLQCPVCKGFSEEILPAVVENRVRSGEAKLEFRNFAIIDERSIPAGAAALAAGEQGRGWSFVDLFYRNQGLEGTDYVTDEFLTAIARGAGVPDVARWNQDRGSRRLTSEVEATSREAERLGFTGTPSFAVEGPGTAGKQTLGTPQSSGAIESAIDDAS
jgi:protein-disulfide isomerase